jgi:glycine/D-amino acid oxidase-like deaminating enzyme
MPKYLILGQGLAGTVLSMRLHEQGIDHLVLDQPQLSTSSKIAGGLVNPIVLKRLKMVHQADLFMSEIEPFYTKWESILEQSFFVKQPIAHLIHSQEEQNQWLEKSSNPPFNTYLGNIAPNTSTSIIAPFGFGIMQHTAWLKTSSFLSSYRVFLSDRNQLIEETAEATDSDTLKEYYQVDSILNCTGHLFKDQLLQQKVFTPTRGELIVIKSDDIPEEYLYHAGVFILPLGNKLFKVGATYHWDNLSDTPTEEGKLKLINGLEKIFTGSYELVDHIAGVRPNISDRKPLLGFYKDQYVFNGMGSRGVLMAPLLSKLFVDYLLNGTELPESYNLNRFLK